MANAFWEWLNKQPERIELENKRGKLKAQYEESDRNARNALRMSMAFRACAEKIEDGFLTWQGTSETADETMYKIYGFHPELAVDDQSDVMDHLNQQAFERAAVAAAHYDQARTTEQEWKALGSEYLKQYETLKPKWEALQSNNKEESK
jgi:hypothetical protein